MTTTDFRAVLTDMPLSYGSHDPVEEPGEACVMEKVSILYALSMGLDPIKNFTDLPFCTNDVIALTAQEVNDGAEDSERQRLNALIPRLLRARKAGELERRVTITMTLTMIERHLRDFSIAEGVSHLDQTESQARAACAEVHRYLDGELNERQMKYRLDKAMAAGDYAAVRVYQIATSTSNHRTQEACARVTNLLVYETPGDPMVLLDELLDVHEECRIKEGIDIYTPEAWEDAALAFVNEYMSEKEAV